MNHNERRTAQARAAKPQNRGNRRTKTRQGALKQALKEYT